MVSHLRRFHGMRTGEMRLRENASGRSAATCEMRCDAYTCAGSLYVRMFGFHALWCVCRLDCDGGLHPRIATAVIYANGVPVT